MSNEKKQEQYKPYKPEEPVDKATRQHEQQEVREAAKHAAQEIAGEELGDTSPVTPKTQAQAEKELKQAVHKLHEEEKKK